MAIVKCLCLEKKVRINQKSPARMHYKWLNQNVKLTGILRMRPVAAANANPLRIP